MFENRRLSLDVQIPVWTIIWKIDVKFWMHRQRSGRLFGKQMSKSGRTDTGLDVYLENER